MLSTSQAIHLLNGLTFDGSGGVHAMSEFNTQGLTGVSLLTGTRYHAADGGTEVFNLKVGETATEIFNFRLIGQGPASNQVIHRTMRFTVNANGVVTAEFVNVVAECK